MASTTALRALSARNTFPSSKLAARNTSSARVAPRSLRLRVEAFKITFKTPSGESNTIDCSADTYILSAAQAAGVTLPHSCKSGACCTCAAKIESGAVDQSDQYILDEGQLEAGFMLPCASYPRSDLVILTHQEENLYNVY